MFFFSGLRVPLVPLDAKYYGKSHASMMEINTRRPASTGIFFAQLQIFWSTLQNYCFEFSFQRVLTNINSTTDFCTLCKRVSRFSVEIFLSHSAEKFCRWTSLCFRKSLVSKNVRDKRGGGYHNFPSKLFCLTVLNHFVKEAFCVSQISGYRKNLSLRGEYHDFLSKFFLSRSTEKLRRGTFLCCVSENFL